MVSKNHRVNTDFQILHFLIGSCHTPDGAYSLLCELKEEREDTIKCIESTELKQKAAMLKAQRLLTSKDEVDQLLGQAELSEINAKQETFDKNVQAAKEELEFINLCIEKLQPYRKYSNLTENEAHSAMQQEEWLQELIRRAENLLLTTGSISPDQFETMRMHPEFSTKIIPAITYIKHVIEQGTIENLFTPTEGSPKYLLDSYLKESDLTQKLLESSINQN